MGSMIIKDSVSVMFSEPDKLVLPIRPLHEHLLVKTMQYFRYLVDTNIDLLSENDPKANVAKSVLGKEMSWKTIWIYFQAMRSRNTSS